MLTQLVLRREVGRHVFLSCLYVCKMFFISEVGSCWGRYQVRGAATQLVSASKRWPNHTKPMVESPLLGDWGSWKSKSWLNMYNYIYNIIFIYLFYCLFQKPFYLEPWNRWIRFVASSRAKELPLPADKVAQGAAFEPRSLGISRAFGNRSVFEKNGIGQPFSAFGYAGMQFQTSDSLGIFPTKGHSLWKLKNIHSALPSPKRYPMAHSHIGAFVIGAFVKAIVAIFVFNFWRPDAFDPLPQAAIGQSPWLWGT